MRSYVKFILIVGALALYMGLAQLSKGNEPAASGGCGCGGGSCSVAPPAAPK